MPVKSKRKRLLNSVKGKRATHFARTAAARLAVVVVGLANKALKNVNIPF
jgi:hypothetical protein